MYELYGMIKVNESILTRLALLELQMDFLKKELIRIESRIDKIR